MHKIKNHKYISFRISLSAIRAVLYLPIVCYAQGADIFWVGGEKYENISAPLKMESP